VIMDDTAPYPLRAELQSLCEERKPHGHNN
jgi:hypothetical protein